jgi:hypothetical protein
MMTFPTEWKVIKFHGSKPPTRYFMVILRLSDGPSDFRKKNVETRARNKRFFIGIEIIFSLTIGILV